MVNCQDVTSFKRMVEGFSRIVGQLDDRGDLITVVGIDHSYDVDYSC